MLTIDEALDAVRSRAVALPPSRRPLADCAGRALAEDVAADRDAPPFDKAIVDGYAVHSADLLGVGAGVRLRVVAEITAGRTPTGPINPGEAAPIMTGAPLPPGSDAVVMVERTRRPAEDLVEIDDPTVAPGRNWTPRGREMRAGDLVLKAGTRLTAPRIGLLASVGRAEALVIPSPTVSILPTGDELVEPGSEPGPGQIRNSNAPLLRAWAESLGGRAEALPIAPDEPEVLRALIRRGLEADILLITGGVSAGTRDLVPAALADLGVDCVFHKVRIKPGKPLWFGVGPIREGRPAPLVFGLPGNPVSGLVGALVFVRPAFEVLAGLSSARPTKLRARLAAPFEHRGERPTFHPSRLVEGPDGPEVEPLAWSGSADLRTAAEADGFAFFPAGDRLYDAGQAVDFLPVDPS